MSNKTIKLNCNLNITDETYTNALISKTSSELSGINTFLGSTNVGESNAKGSLTVKVKTINIDTGSTTIDTGAVSINAKSTITLEGGGRLTSKNDIFISDGKDANRSIELKSDGNVIVKGKIKSRGILELEEDANGKRTKQPTLFIHAKGSEKCGIGAYSSSDYGGSSDNGIRFSKATTNYEWKSSGQVDNNFCFRFDGKVYGAVWNDLVDIIEVPENTVLEYGKCYTFDGEKYSKSNKYAQGNAIGIHSDTYGFAMGSKGSSNELNVAVAGFVLAYVDKRYKTGTPLTCTKDGNLTKANLYVRVFHPDRIVGNYWKDELEETWNKIQVKNRNWIKVK